MTIKINLADPPVPQFRALSARSMSWCTAKVQRRKEPSITHILAVDKDAAESVESYVRTRFLRFLVSLRKITQHATRSTYTWVPQQAWDRTWTDEKLYKKYGLTKDDIAFIESRIRPMEANGE